MWNVYSLNKTLKLLKKINPKRYLLRALNFEEFTNDPVFFYENIILT